MKQWEILKGRPPGFATDHWFVITSPPERCTAERLRHVNGLGCFTLRGEPAAVDVVLDSADGFEGRTACGCDIFFVLEKASLHSPLGIVSWERQQQIKSKVKALLRF